MTDGSDSDSDVSDNCVDNATKILEGAGRDTGNVDVSGLIKASSKGNKKASHLLKKYTHILLQGADEKKSEDIQKCLKESDTEKSLKHAAKKIFKKLAKAERRDSVSKDHFLGGLAEISKDKREKRILETTAKMSDSDVLKEKEFIDIILGKLTGKANDVLMLDKEDEASDTYNESSLKDKIIKYPGQTIESVMNYSLEYAAKYGTQWLTTLIPTHQIQMLFFIALYSVLSVPVVTGIISVAMFYISLTSMVLNTLKMFHGERAVKEILALAKILHRYNRNVDESNLELEYRWKSLTPYWMYIGSLIVMVASYSVCDKAFIPSSELTIISLFLCAACFYALGHNLLMSFLLMTLNISSTFGTLLEFLSEVPILSYFVNALSASLFSVEVFDSLYINFSIPSMCYLSAAVVFIFLARQDSWRGTYRILLPHLVCFLWWQAAIVFYVKSTWYGIARAFFGSALVLVLLPVFGVFAIFYVIVVVLRNIDMQVLLKMCTTLVILSAPVVVYFIMTLNRSFKDVLKSLEGVKKQKVMFWIVLFCAILVGTRFFVPAYKPTTHRLLSLEDYEKHCISHDNDINDISNQIECSHLAGMQVQWQGSVTKVAIKSVENKFESILQVLPNAMGNWLMCMYGERYEDTKDVEHLQSITVHPCHVKNYNSYTFKISVKTGDIAIQLEAGNSLHGKLMQIKNPLTPISFRATIKSPSLVSPIMQLHDLSCLNCTDSILMTGLVPAELTLLARLQNALVDTVNFFISPLFEIKGY